MKVTLIGIDLAKSVFQVCGVNQAGKAVFNKQLRRQKLVEFLMRYPEALITMEACSGSNYWGRELRKFGFEVRLIPPQHVKPFVKGNKNDRNDAFAITEAARRPHMRWVEPRSLAQTDLIQIHRVLDRRIRQRTATVNQIRGFLNEFGVVVRQGRAPLRTALHELLSGEDSGLTAKSRALFAELLDEWQACDEAIGRLEMRIRTEAQADADGKRLMGIKGVAEKTATAAVAHAGNGGAYQSGRHFAANLGLVPKEHSSGGKQQLGGVTRRGNCYLRRLLVQGAWSVLRNAERSDDRLSRWARQVQERRGKHKAVMAVANKLARIIWSMLYHQTEYRAA